MHDWFIKSQQAVLACAMRGNSARAVCGALGNFAPLQGRNGAEPST